MSEKYSWNDTSLPKSFLPKMSTLLHQHKPIIKAILKEAPVTVDSEQVLKFHDQYEP